MTPRPDLFKIVSGGSASDHSLASYSSAGEFEILKATRVGLDRSVSASGYLGGGAGFSDQVSVRSSPGSLYRSSSFGSISAGAPLVSPTPHSAAGSTTGNSGTGGLLKDGAGGEFYAGTYFPTIAEEEEERIGTLRRKKLLHPDSSTRLPDSDHGQEGGEQSWVQQHRRTRSYGNVPLRRSVSENYGNTPSTMPPSNNSPTPSRTGLGTGGSLSDTKSTPQKRQSRLASSGHNSTRSDASGHIMTRSGSVDPNFFSTPVRPTSSVGVSSPSSSAYSRADTPDYYGYGRPDSTSPVSVAASSPGAVAGDWGDGTIKSKKEGAAAMQRVCKFIFLVSLFYVLWKYTFIFFIFFSFFRSSAPAAPFS